MKKIKQNEIVYNTNKYNYITFKQHKYNWGGATTFWNLYNSDNLINKLNNLNLLYIFSPKLLNQPIITGKNITGIQFRLDSSFNKLLSGNWPNSVPVDIDLKNIKIFMSNTNKPIDSSAETFNKLEKQLVKTGIKLDKEDIPAYNNPNNFAKLSNLINLLFIQEKILYFKLNQ